MKYLLLIIIFIIYILRKFKSPYDGKYLISSYGILLKVSYGFIRTYQVTNQSIMKLPLMNGRINKGLLNSQTMSFNVSLEEGQLLLINKVSTEEYRAVQTDINYKKTSKTNNPQTNYDMFYQIFEEHYAFFDLYGVDWKKNKNLDLSQLKNNDDFLHLIKGLLSEINDDHLTINYKDISYSPYKDLPKWYDTETLKSFVSLINNIYVKEMTYLAGRAIRYGYLKEDIGYINIATMAGEINELRASSKITKAFETALKTFENTNTLVLDTRFNSGGYDGIALQLSSYFIKEKKHVYSKHINDQAYDVYVYPKDIQYQGQVILLTSTATVSAADVFAHIVSDLDQVLVIGEKTAGFFSTAIPKLLPNVMKLTLSSEIYLDNKGHPLEGNGIIPDVLIKMETCNINKGIDPHLEWVLTNSSLSDL